MLTDGVSWLNTERNESACVPVYMSFCHIGEAPVLIATDVASRGLDIKDITSVYNTLVCIKHTFMYSEACSWLVISNKVISSSVLLVICTALKLQMCLLYILCV